MMKMTQKTNTCIFCKRDFSAHSPSEAISCVKALCRMSLEVGG